MAERIALKSRKEPVQSRENDDTAGNPNLDRICTSHVELQNLSIRMGMHRMSDYTLILPPSRNRRRMASGQKSPAGEYCYSPTPAVVSLPNDCSARYAWPN